MAAARAMPVEGFRVVAPDRRRHGEKMCDLVAKAFSSGGYFRFHEVCRTGYILNSHYDWAVSRIGLLGDRIATHYGVWNVRMRIGTAVVRVGGIGAVATDADCRKRGLMARTARASVRAMRDGGYDLSLLFGISDFYHRFGYTRAWSESDYIIGLGDLPKEKPNVRLGTFNPKPRNDTAALYNRAGAGLTGTAVRPTYTRIPWPRPMQGRRWTDARGRLAGYVVFEVHDGRFECCEACGNVDAILRVLAVLARQYACREVRLETMHDASPLIRRVRRGTCRVETRHHRCGGAMVALVDLPAALEKMRGELSRRLRQSHLAGWRGSLLLVHGREAATLAIDRSRVRVTVGGTSKHAIRGGDGIVQLLIGTDEPAAVIEATRLKPTGDARRLADILFPNEHPRMALQDRF